MATPFRSDAQITLHSVSNPTGSWAVLYSRCAAKIRRPHAPFSLTISWSTGHQPLDLRANPKNRAAKLTSSLFALKQPSGRHKAA